MPLEWRPHIYRKQSTVFQILIVILVTFGMVACVSAPREQETAEYPRPGALSSNFNEGPHLIYQNDASLLLQAVEVDGQMTLNTNRFKRSDLETISVFKSGYLPRRFEVQLREEITETPTYYPSVDTTFAVSDIEGNFNTLINLMQQNGVIDESLDWTFGSGHFVMIGDVFDRGNHVTEMLWFLYRLEQQALESGGYVHLLMGNHEALNLRGDLRYVEPKYLTFAKLTEAQFGINYTMLFGNNTELGRWLRSKNVIEKIGDKIFVHAGISPALVESGYSLEKINSLARKMLDTPKVEFDGADSLLWGTYGPYWYRGYFDVNRDSWGPRATQADVDQVLDHFEASQVVVGHTHVDKPELRYNNRICAINVVPPADHMISAPHRQAYGLLIKGSHFFIAGENGLLSEIGVTQ